MEERYTYSENTILHYGAIVSEGSSGSIVFGGKIQWEEVVDRNIAVTSRMVK